jgi:tRNA dimethylallyltransferase
MNKQTPLIVIVGTTASGKTSLAIDLALRCNGEIICADSRTIYKDMDIGTAKPSPQERKQVAHHLLDVVSPDQAFTVFDFKKIADLAIKDIVSRRKIPILVGGSGLYIDAILYDYQFRPINKEARRQYEIASIDELQDILKQKRIPLPENKQNKRHLIRIAETGMESPKQRNLRSNTFVFGLQVDPEEQKERSRRRLDEMLKEGLIEETTALGRKYGWTIPPMQAPAYKAFRAFIQNHCTLEESKVLCLQYEAQLAKKQRTWFKRNKSIQWYSDPSKIVDISTTLLNT